MDQGAYELAVQAADASGEFTPLTPSRLLDTRDGTGRNGVVGPLNGGSSFDVQVTGHGGVPATGLVGAVVLNVTAVTPNDYSFLTVWPSGVARPLISNLNFAPTQTVPNLVTVAVGTGGKVSVYDNTGSVHVVFDVVGFYASATGPFGNRFHGVTPIRLFDTRDNTGGVGTSPVGPNTTLHFNVKGEGPVPASGVAGVVMNVTVVAPHRGEFPDRVPRRRDPASRVQSQLRREPGRSESGDCARPREWSRRLLQRVRAAHVVGDVVGYYDDLKATNAGRFVGLTPARRIDSRVSTTPPPGKLPANDAFFLRMTNTAGLPADGIGSVVINVTVTEPTDPSFLTVTPPDSPLPLASNLNFVGGQTVPNLVIVKPTSAPVVALAIPTPGWIAIYNKFGATHVVVDVFGYFTASFTDVTGLNIDDGVSDLYGTP